MDFDAFVFSLRPNFVPVLHERLLELKILKRPWCDFKKASMCLSKPVSLWMC